MNSFIETLKENLTDAYYTTQEERGESLLTYWGNNKKQMVNKVRDILESEECNEETYFDLISSYLLNIKCSEIYDIELDEWEIERLYNRYLKAENNAECYYEMFFRDMDLLRLYSNYNDYDSENDNSIFKNFLENIYDGAFQYGSYKGAVLSNDGYYYKFDLPATITDDQEHGIDKEYELYLKYKENGLDWLLQPLELVETIVSEEFDTEINIYRQKKVELMSECSQIDTPKISKRCTKKLSHLEKTINRNAMFSKNELHILIKDYGIKKVIHLLYCLDNRLCAQIVDLSEDNCGFYQDTFKICDYGYVRRINKYED